MTPRKRTNKIKKRFSENQPLNLSAVENECPELLEGLFHAENFIGWRATLEQAGISYSEIVTFVNPEIACRLCEHTGAAIFQHLSDVHGITTQEYREEFSDAEVVSEVKRSAAIGNRHDENAKLFEPHWEPAWSRKYLLDRMFTYSQKGIAMNYTNFAKNEPGMAAYCRRIFGSWDEGVQQIGLSPKDTREAKECQPYTGEEVLEELKQTASDDPDRITLPILAREELLIRKCFRIFTTYDQALDEAGLDPTDFIPALDDPKLAKKRQQLINATNKRLKLREKQYDPEHLARFINRYQTVITHFYVNWHNFVESIGTTTRELFFSPDHLLYDSKEKVIIGLKTRDRVGLSIRHVTVAEQDRSLVIMAAKHFENYSDALDAAGLEQPPTMECAAHYQSGEEVLREIRRRYRTKKSLYHNDVLAEDTPLVKWSKHYYGGFREAIVEAGIPDPGIKPHIPVQKFNYPDKAAIKSEIQRRHSEGESIALSVVCKPGRPGGDHTLYLSAIRHYDTWLNAVTEAGFPTGIIHYSYDFENRRYYCKEDVIDVIQRHHKGGGSLSVSHRNHTRNQGGLGITLYKKAETFFGSFPAAVEAAGIDLSYTEPTTA